MYTTKEPTRRTWPDFQKLFSQGNSWDFCWCMHFQRPRTLADSQRGHRAERGKRNRREKKELLERAQTHGILLYANGEPVGWCQYGPPAELPRIDNNRAYRALHLETNPNNHWRITCFVTIKKLRRRGVATAALQAVLESIAKKGGGIVEAYPMIPLGGTAPRTCPEMWSLTWVRKFVHARNTSDV